MPPDSLNMTVRVSFSFFPQSFTLFPISVVTIADMSHHSRSPVTTHQSPGGLWPSLSAESQTNAD